MSEVLSCAVVYDMNARRSESVTFVSDKESKSRLFVVKKLKFLFLRDLVFKLLKPVLYVSAQVNVRAVIL